MINKCLLLTACLYSVSAFSHGPRLGTRHHSTHWNPIYHPNTLPSNPVPASSGKYPSTSTIPRTRSTALSLSLSLSSNIFSGGAAAAVPTIVGKLEPLLQIGSIPVVMSAGILLGYHIRLIQGEQAGKLTWRSQQAQNREKWAQFVRDTEGWLYAVQTLRNAITANTFLATTVLSLLTVVSGKMWEFIRTMPANFARTRLSIQFGCTAFCLLLSAYEFLQSARLMTHAGFMFPVAKGTKADAIMRKSQSSQWLGLRWLYISFGFQAWVWLGDISFLISSMILVKFFTYIDRVPSDLDVV